MVKMTDVSSAMFTGAAWRFLGVYSGRINAESDLGILWKASSLIELVTSI
jgi:hypothetical protein